MNNYYLLSQLPSLEHCEESSELPITQESFREICSRYMNSNSMKILKELTLIPPKERKQSGSTLVDEWNDRECQLRIALANVRASQLNKNYDKTPYSIPASLLQVVNTAISMDSPLSAERYLGQYRLETLDQLRPLDNFSEEFVYYYALRLMLLERSRLFEAVKGRESYEKIYSSILSKGEQGN